jgi:hypothetical protein
MKDQKKEKKKKLMDENENASCTHFSVCLFLLNAIRLFGGFGVLYSKIFVVAQIF